MSTTYWIVATITFSVIVLYAISLYKEGSKWDKPAKNNENQKQSAQ